MTELKRVINITGMGRSGSTMLGKVISSVSGVVDAGEAGNIWRGVNRGRRCSCGHPVSECDFWTEVFSTAFGSQWRSRTEELEVAYGRFRRLRNWVPMRYPVLSSSLHRHLGELAAMLRPFYGAIANISDCETVVDSTKLPTYGLALRAAIRVPAAFHAVHLVRDSRAVCYSWSLPKKAPVDWGHDLVSTRSLQQVALHWEMRNRWATIVRRMADGGCLMRYEDFVQAPEGELTKAFEALGLRPEDARQAVAGGTVQPTANHIAGGNPDRFAQGPVRIVPDERWKKAMRPMARALVTALTWPGLRRYGYI